MRRISFSDDLKAKEWLYLKQPPQPRQWAIALNKRPCRSIQPLCAVRQARAHAGKRSLWRPGMSIKIRLLLLTATGLLAALFMGLDSLFNNARTADAVNDNQVSLTALRNHLEADMMHDALRADAFSALLVGLGKSPSSADEVRSSLQEHAARFRRVLEANQQLPTSTAIKQALEQVQPNLNAYQIGR